MTTKHRTNLLAYFQSAGVYETCQSILHHPVYATVDQWVLVFPAAPRIVWELGLVEQRAACPPMTAESAGAELAVVCAVDSVDIEIAVLS